MLRCLGGDTRGAGRRTAAPSLCQSRAACRTNASRTREQRSVQKRLQEKSYKIVEAIQYAADKLQEAR